MLIPIKLLTLTDYAKLTTLLGSKKNSRKLTTMASIAWTFQAIYTSAKRTRVLLLTISKLWRRSGITQVMTRFGHSRVMRNTYTSPSHSLIGQSRCLVNLSIQSWGSVRRMCLEWSSISHICLSIELRNLSLQLSTYMQMNCCSMKSLLLQRQICKKEIQQIYHSPAV